MHSFNGWIDDELEAAKKNFAQIDTFTGADHPLWRDVRVLEKVSKMWRESMEYAVSMQHLCERPEDNQEDES